MFRATFFCSNSARFYLLFELRKVEHIEGPAFSPKARPTSPICPSSSPIRLRKCTVPCRIVRRVDTDETNSFFRYRQRDSCGLQAQTHLIIALTYLFNFPLFLLDKGIQTLKVELLTIRVLNGLDERSEGFQVLRG